MNCDSAVIMKNNVIICHYIGRIHDFAKGRTMASAQHQHIT